MQTEPNSFFSSREIQLLYDAEIYPLKRSVTEKLFHVFGNLALAIKDTAIHREFPFPAGTDISTGKISKGENHLQYPYVVLDFPRKFEKYSIFSFRNMFWFGHYFSSSLILGGDDMRTFSASFFKNMQALYGCEIYFSVFKDPWGHAVTHPYYVFIETLSKKQIEEHTNAHGYIKITNRFMADNPEEIMDKCVKNYALMLSSIL